MSDVNDPVFEPEPEQAKSLTDADASGNPRIDLALRVLAQMQQSLAGVQQLLQGSAKVDRTQFSDLQQAKQALDEQLEDLSGCRIVEGVFNGCAMIGEDGKTYEVPPNYASKSRLVEGDVLKLTIKPQGEYIYKQIGPIERKRTTGTLAFDESASDYVVVCDDGSTYKVLRASVTYFDGSPGDKAVIFVPASGESVWAAVETIEA